MFRQRPEYLPRTDVCIYKGAAGQCSVEGEPIDRYCDARRLPQHDRLELFRKVCSAVHFAHHKTWWYIAT